MKSSIVNKLTLFMMVSLFASNIVFVSCSGETEKESLTQEQMVSKLDETSKEAVFESVLASKNADALLVKLSVEQKSALFDKLLTADKKNEAFESILAEKRNEGKVVELLNATEKSSIFDELLKTKTNKDFIVGILTETGNETLYAEVKEFLNGEFTQDELIALLNDDSKTSVYESVLASKNADALLAKLSDEQKAALFDKMLTTDKKNEAFESILAEKRSEGKVVELLNATEKSSIFDELLVTKKSKDFIVGILEEDESLYSDVKNYITEKLSKEELVVLLSTKDTTAPAKVQTLTATSKDTGIELTWTDPSDEDLWGFVIGYYEDTASRALVLDNSKHEFVVGKSSNENKSNSTFVGNLTDKKSYIFYIKSVDENFNVSEAKESASCTYVEKFVEVKVPVEVEKKLEAGTYTIYHLQQDTTGGKAFANYTLKDTDSNKSVAANSTITDLKKTYEGFTAKSMTLLTESEIYVFYDRNEITYTFNTGSKGKFEDGTTSKEVKGLYGASYTRPKVPTSDDYNFVKWQDSSGNSAPLRFEAENKIFNTVWRSKSDGPVIPEGFVEVPAGTFKMGSNKGSSKNIPVHNVTISNSFYMCDHEVTQAEYKTIMGTNPSYHTSYIKSGEVQENRPVEKVNWYMAIVYCNKLSISEGLEPCYAISDSTDPSDWGTIPTSNNNTWNAVKCDFSANGYRLPTEAEWEYAARAGDDTVDSLIWSGTNTESSLGNYAWYHSSNENSGTHEVKKKNANSLGLYDMSGNVSEWCWDWYNDYSTGDVTDPLGASSGSLRVNRGGYYYDNSGNCAVSFRGYGYAKNNDDNLGFRVCRSSSN